MSLLHFTLKLSTSTRCHLQTTTPDLLLTKSPFLNLATIENSDWAPSLPAHSNEALTTTLFRSLPPLSFLRIALLILLYVLLISLISANSPLTQRTNLCSILSIQIPHTQKRTILAVKFSETIK